jgi:hypothetical protein
MVGDPQLLAALLAVLLERLEPDLEGGFGAGLVSGHGHLQSEDFAYQLTWLPALVQESFAVLAKKGTSGKVDREVAEQHDGD